MDVTVNLNPLHTSPVWFNIQVFEVLFQWVYFSMKVMKGTCLFFKLCPLCRVLISRAVSKIFKSLYHLFSGMLSDQLPKMWVGYLNPSWNLNSRWNPMTLRFGRAILSGLIPWSPDVRRQNWHGTVMTAKSILMIITRYADQTWCIFY